jgi:hypothetical protein
LLDAVRQLAECHRGGLWTAFFAKRMYVSTEIHEEYQTKEHG